MFTIKLYRNMPGLGREQLRIAEAQSFTINPESRNLQGITLHRASGDDEVYYVGTISQETSYADEHRRYDRAIIENAAGKTSEVIFSNPVEVLASDGEKQAA